MQHNSTSYNPKTCYEFMVRSNDVLKPYAGTMESGLAQAFLKGIELLVMIENISTMNDPALVSAIDMASKGTGIPTDVLHMYAQMAVALNKPVHI